jgi:hypothetical protein
MQVAYDFSNGDYHRQRASQNAAAAAGWAVRQTYALAECPRCGAVSVARPPGTAVGGEETARTAVAEGEALLADAAGGWRRRYRDGFLAYIGASALMVAAFVMEGGLSLRHPFEAPYHVVLPACAVVLALIVLAFLRAPWTPLPPPGAAYFRPHAESPWVAGRVRGVAPRGGNLQVAALLALATAVGVPTLFVAVNADTIFH